MERKESSTFEFVANSVNINGEAMGYHQNLKVCVKNLLPGEKALVRSVFLKNNFCMAKVEKLLTSSPDRIPPACAYVNNCGGCDMQCLVSKQALNLKKQILQDYFKKYYDKDIEINDSCKSFYYRNKASFSVKGSKIGLVQDGSNRIVEVDKCLILKPELNQVLQISKRWLTTFKNPFVTHIVARALDGKISVTVVVSGKKSNEIEKFKEYLIEVFGKGNLYLYINYNKSTEVILGDKWELVYGNGEICNYANGIKYFVHPYSFLQINDDVRDKIYNYVLSLVKGKVVIEGYSGIGILSAMMAKQAKKVFSVEINKNANLDAEKIKQINNIKNLENINGNCSQILPELINQNKDAIFVVDPPRSGCDSLTLQALKSNNVSHIVYISCNPYTLKQNIGFLDDKYKVDSLQIFDMFPQTSHVEMVAQLSIRN